MGGLEFKIMIMPENKSSTNGIGIRGDSCPEERSKKRLSEKPGQIHVTRSKDAGVK
jgi:hypothetical protein